MQGFEVSGLPVRWPSESGLKYCRTDSRTAAGHIQIKDNENSHVVLSGCLSGAVRWGVKSRCLSGCVSLGRARPDTPDKSSKGGEK